MGIGAGRQNSAGIQCTNQYPGKIEKFSLAVVHGLNKKVLYCLTGYNTKTWKELAGPIFLASHLGNVGC